MSNAAQWLLDVYVIEGRSKRNKVGLKLRVVHLAADFRRPLTAPVTAEGGHRPRLAGSIVRPRLAVYLSAPDLSHAADFDGVTPVTTFGGCQDGGAALTRLCRVTGA